jgi:hypothetical protein
LAPKWPRFPADHNGLAVGPTVTIAEISPENSSIDEPFGSPLALRLHTREQTPNGWCFGLSTAARDRGHRHVVEMDRPTWAE